MTHRSALLALPFLALSLSLSACGGDTGAASEATSSPTPATTTTTPTPTATPDATPTAVMSEDEALQTMAGTLSASATTQQWKALAQAVCDQLAASEKPLDENGDTSLSAADDIWAQPQLIGVGDAEARINTADLDGEKMANLIFLSTQIACPEYQKDASAAHDTIAAK